MDDTYNFYRIHKLIIHTFLAIILIGIYLEFWEETNKKMFFPVNFVVTHFTVLLLFF